MICRVREARSQTDNILGTYCRLLQNVTVQNAWHKKYHYPVLDFLSGAMPDVNSR